MFPGTEVNTAAIEGFSYISPDWPAYGSKRYYASNELTGELSADIFQATWVPEPSAMVLVIVGVLALIISRRR